jgi:predicted MFS family arabinose efflux permease
MLYLLGFLMDFSITTALLAFNFRAVDLRSSPLALGVLVASYSACYSISCLLMARRLASIKERSTLTLSPMIIALVIIMGMWARSVWMLIVLAGLAGAVASHFWPPLEHWLGRMAPPEQLYRVLGTFNIWWCSGISLGTALCGLSYGWHPRLPLVTSCFCLLLIAGLVQVVSRRTRRAVPLSHTVADAPAHPQAGFTKRLFLTYARISIFLTYAAMGSIFALFPKLGQHLGMSKPAVSRILFFLFFGQLASFVVLGKSSKWQYRIVPLLSIHALSSVAFALLFVLESSAVLAIAFVVIGFAAGLSWFSSLFYTLHRPDTAEAFAGVHESLLSGGRVIGPLVAGLIANFSTLKYPYLFFCLVFALLSVYMIRESRKRRA